MPHRQIPVDRLSCCRDALNTGTLTSAADRGQYSDYYQCGLTMLLNIDAAIRKRSADEQDLFSIWTTLIDDTGKGELWDSDNFLAKAQPLIGPTLVEQLRSLIVDKQNDPATSLRKLGSK